MKKKLLTVALAATMTVASVFSAIAAETELDCTAFWAVHTAGYEVDADGVEVSFTNTTYDTATANWDTPNLVVYTGDEAKVNGTGYTEYAVIRADAYAWAPKDVAGAGTGDANTGDFLTNWTAAGYSLTKDKAPADDAAWATWLKANKAGSKCTVKATVSGKKATIVFTDDAVTTTTVVPVDSTKKVYISISGELTKLTNIKEVAATNGATDATTAAGGAKTDTPKTDTPKTGDVATTATVVMMVGAAAVVVALKKKTIAE